MDEEQPVSRISRRKALKRIGAGAAIAWSAPVLSSLRTPAFAAGTPRCEEPCRDDCSDGSFSVSCGASGPFGCFCSRDVTGKCFCWVDDACSNRPDAGPGGSCPSGQTAVSTCCDQASGFNVKCWLPCGDPASSSQGVTSGPTGSGT